jgi:hypothetical protein
MSISGLSNLAGIIAVRYCLVLFLSHLSVHSASEREATVCKCFNCLRMCLQKEPKNLSLSQKQRACEVPVLIGNQELGKVPSAFHTVLHLFIYRVACSQGQHGRS